MSSSPLGVVTGRLSLSNLLWWLVSLDILLLLAAFCDVIEDGEEDVRSEHEPLLESSFSWSWNEAFSASPLIWSSSAVLRKLVRWDWATLTSPM